MQLGLVLIIVLETQLCADIHLDVGFRRSMMRRVSLRAVGWCRVSLREIVIDLMTDVKTVS
jgi:hypothetical protein